VVLGTGALAANLIGQKVLRWAELALARIPVVKGIYSSVKQVSDTLLAPGGQAFRKPLLVRFPHRDSWTIAFLTGNPGPGVVEHLDGEHLERLCADHAQPHLRLLHHRAAPRHSGTRHERRRGPQVHHLASVSSPLRPAAGGLQLPSDPS
jgi:hypothetical protein